MTDYKQRLDALTEARADYERAKEKLNRLLRDIVADVCFTRVKRPVPLTIIAKHAGYTREHVSNLAIKIRKEKETNDEA